MARMVPPPTAVPLGSLTQPGAREASCRTCGSQRVTRIEMQLTDGSTVDFTSCLSCEGRTWEHEGREISREDVLVRSQRSVARS
jgi:hypothetical protein